MDMSFFCKQKTAYEMRIRDWSSDVCSSDLKSIEQILERYVARFRDRRADWNAFEDAKIEGYKRAQHRFIGAGGSGKHEGADFIPAGGFTLSVMYVEPGQGNVAHTHEVEEVFFVLQGFLTVFLEDDQGDRKSTRLNSSH